MQQKANKKNKQIFDDLHEVEEILDMKKAEGCHQLLIKFKNSLNACYLDYNIVKENYPQELIKFFENNIVWKNN